MKINDYMSDDEDDKKDQSLNPELPSKADLADPKTKAAKPAQPPPPSKSNGKKEESK